MLAEAMDNFSSEMLSKALNLIKDHQEQLKLTSFLEPFDFPSR